MADRDDIDDIMDTGVEKPYVQEYQGVEVEGLKELDFEGIEAPRARMINFGEEFQKWGDKHKIEFLKKLASSMNHAADIMQQERNKLLVVVDGLKEQLHNVETNLHIQKEIIRKAITDNNANKEDYIRVIQELEAKVRSKDKAIGILKDKLGKS